MKTLGSIVKDSNRDLFCITTDYTAFDAARYMAERNIGAVTVVEGERVAGLFSERDLMRRVIAKGRDPREVRVGEVMTTDLIIASPHESYEDAIAKMQAARCRHLPVVEDQQFVGLVSLRDLLKVDADEKAEEIRLLNTYINYVPPTRARGA
ncbi:MAG: CBS domain-containing protein [Blastocatellia bacterium]